MTFVRQSLMGALGCFPAWLKPDFRDTLARVCTTPMQLRVQSRCKGCQINREKHGRQFRIRQTSTMPISTDAWTCEIEIGNAGNLENRHQPVKAETRLIAIKSISCKYLMKLGELGTTLLIHRPGVRIPAGVPGIERGYSKRAVTPFVWCLSRCLINETMPL